MKKFFNFFMLFFTLIPFISNVISCNNININNKNLLDSLEEIIYPTNGWPPQSNEYLDTWEYNLKKTSNNLSNVLDSLLKIYNDGYQNLFHENFYKDNSGIDKDQNNVPIKDVEELLNEVYTSDYIQYYAAYSLRQYYIEMNINKIKNPKNKYWINEDEVVGIYSMYWWRGLALYDWSKIYLKETGTNWETAIDINFYDYYHAAEDWTNDSNPDIDRVYDWGQVQKKYSQTVPLDRNDPKNRNDKVLFIQKTYINPIMYDFIDEIYLDLYPDPILREG